MGLYDQLFKEMFQDKDMIIEFINLFLPSLKKFNITPDKITIEKTKFTDLNYGDKESDILFKINYDNNDLYLFLLLEHQSSIDYLMQFRILEYMVRIWRNYINRHKSKNKGFKLPPIIPVVFYNGKRKWTAEIWYMEKIQNWQLFDIYTPRFKYELIDLSQIDRKRLIDIKNALGLLLSIDKTDKKNIKEAFQEIEKAFRGLPKNEKKKFTEYLNKFLMVLSQKNRIENIEINIESGEEEFRMFENFVKAIDESLKESFEKGIEKGKFEGEKTIAKSLLFKKFGDNIVPYLNNLDYLDIKTIEDLTNNIFDITLNEVIKILKSTKS
ncbi:Rpn family recombination-promoting nuclease/putative transposase [Marinitoga sp. 1155]|uniref:Rpn family recombination-promoting nuclease/putative transposase n=1 Tax=Marinitoga sp. 1155 TaxID=1428448 RepID=UPI000640D4B5|nr:Rpn family recombination-promoting nuclease/putative transposase [Marinitoga sp. 1155]KLO24218.1 flagellar biosynthesis/type III secretory pathway protein [Marinitoga sp. 1155]